MVGGVLAVAFTAVILWLVVLLVARGPDTLGYLFHAEQIGWPHGVQEDDDVHWRWGAWRPAPRDREPTEPPRPVPVEPLRPRLALRQPRSAARARS